jgi:hypothetical protein
VREFVTLTVSTGACVRFDVVAPQPVGLWTDRGAYGIYVESPGAANAWCSSAIVGETVEF